MKIVSSDDKITVYTYKKEDTRNINNYIKSLIKKLKTKYKLNILGFYQINIYKNNKIGMVIDIIKDDEDYFYDLLDLKIKFYEDSRMFLKFHDYFFNNKKDIFILDNDYYIEVNDLSEKDIFYMIEFCSIIYGKEAEEIEKIVSCSIK